MHHTSSAHTVRKQVNEPQIHLIKYIQLREVFFSHVVSKLEMYSHVARVFAAFAGAPWIAKPTLVSD